MKRPASQRYDDGSILCITFLSISGRSRSQHVRIDGKRPLQLRSRWRLESHSTTRLAFGGEPRLLCISRVSEQEQPEKPDLMRTCIMHPFSDSQLCLQSCLLRARHAFDRAEFTDLQANMPGRVSRLSHESHIRHKRAKCGPQTSEPVPAHYNTTTANSPRRHAREK